MERNNNTTDRELSITRIINAPRDLVFQMWTDPKHLEEWWGPTGFTTITSKFDFKIGGGWIYVMRGPDGTVFPNRTIYKEIIKNEFIEYTHDSGVDADPNEFHVTVKFEDFKGKTKFTWTTLLKTAEMRRDLIEKYKVDDAMYQNVDKLEMKVESISNKKEFIIIRTFNAPKSLVWKAHTEAERLAQWWGPKGMKMLKCNLDLKPGGIFHYGMETPDGHQMWGKFVYKEIVPQEKLVFVVSFSDKDMGITRHPMSETWPLEVLNTSNFIEENGRTKIISRGVPINATDEEIKTFEGAFSNMQAGYKGTLDQLDAYLNSVK